VVTGRSISEEAVKRAVNLSMEKYCSVKATIEAVPPSHSVTGLLRDREGISS